MDDEFIKILYVEDNKIDQLAFMIELGKYGKLKLKKDSFRQLGHLLKSCDYT